MIRVKASGPRDAKIAIVGMGPATEEVARGKPFVGPAGRVLNNALAKLGVERDSVYVTNVTETPLPPGSSLHSLPHLRGELARLRQELETLRPNVVVPLGEEPLYFLCNIHNILKWRGSILPSTLTPGLKCVPSVHPAWILRGMDKWEAVFTHIDLKRAIEESDFPEIVLPKRDAITGPSFSTVIEYIRECKKHDVLSVDIEVGYYTRQGVGEINCIGVGFTPGQALCIPLIRVGRTNYWTEVEEAAIWRALAELLEDPTIKKYGQNLSFDWTYFWLHKIYPAFTYVDTMLLHHCLYPDFGATEDVWGRRKVMDEPGHGLAFINSQYTKTPYYKDDRQQFKGDHQLWEYNCKDVMVTLDVGLQMEVEAREEGLWDFYQNYYVKVLPHTMRIEWYGIGVDTKKRELASRELCKREVELQNKVDQTLGWHLNVNSPKQIHRLLYEEKGYQTKRNRKTGRPTADKTTLSYFADKYQDQLLLWVQELRQVMDLRSDIIDQPLGVDERMHTHYKIGGTDSGRWSSTKSILGTGTNLQNIPRDGIARELFLP